MTDGELVDSQRMRLYGEGFSMTADGADEG